MILITTSVSICTGLDYTNVHLVIRTGFSTSVFEIIQEMERCGRRREQKVTNEDFRNANYFA